MSGETTVTMVANLTDDPELRYTPAGVALCKVRVASTPRVLDRQSGQFKDGDPLLHRVAGDGRTRRRVPAYAGLEADLQGLSCPDPSWTCPRRARGSCGQGTHGVG